MLAIATALLAALTAATGSDDGLVTFRGVAVDTSDGGIPAAHVATDPPLATADADASGRFELQLPAGSYVLSIQAPGFAALSETIEVAATDEGPHRFSLIVASRHESLTVTARPGYQAAT